MKKNGLESNIMHKEKIFHQDQVRVNTFLIYESKTIICFAQMEHNVNFMNEKTQFRISHYAKSKQLMKKGY